jgi:hypothetical protein
VVLEWRHLDSGIDGAGHDQQHADDRKRIDSANLLLDHERLGSNGDAAMWSSVCEWRCNRHSLFLDPAAHDFNANAHSNSNSNSNSNADPNSRWHSWLRYGERQDLQRDTYNQSLQHGYSKHRD